MRVASFELNHARQTDRIIRDSHLPDFTITQKDKYKNINIECNSGFYSEVAKPTICSLAQDFIPPIHGFTVQCESVTKNMDKADNQFNLTLFFKLIAASGKSFKVTIHTHHSTRLVQVQGGSFLPDKSTAAQWFVCNILHERFSNLAVTKKINIQKFNQFIAQIGKTTSSLHDRNVCSVCSNQYDCRSKPITCKSCSSTFHRKCLKIHKCEAAHLNQHDILGSGSSSSPKGPSLMLGVNSIPSHANSSTFQFPTQIKEGTEPLVETAIPDDSSTELIMPCFSTLNPTATSFQPTDTGARQKKRTPTSRASSLAITNVSNDPSQTLSTDVVLSIAPRPSSNLPNEQPQEAQRNKSRKPESLFSPQKAETESLKIELSNARTKVVYLENIIIDKDRSILIYKEKVRLLESPQSKNNNNDESFFAQDYVQSI